MSIAENEYGDEFETQKTLLPDGMTIRVDHDMPFESGKEYVLRVKKELPSKCGKLLDESIKMEFRVEAFPE